MKCLGMRMVLAVFLLRNVVTRVVVDSPLSLHACRLFFICSSEIGICARKEKWIDMRLFSGVLSFFFRDFF